MKRLLIANRGEIGVRLHRAAASLDIPTLAVYSSDDANSLHVRVATDSAQLDGVGASGYLDAGQLVELAVAHGCDAVHPGYGFLSEKASFAAMCIDAGLQFVGPSPAVLELFGDKTRARELAIANGVPVLSGTDRPTSLQEARLFLGKLDGRPMMVKALAGGGGRGMRVVRHEEELEATFARCASEAAAAFGNDALYVEALMERARHIEVQLVGDAMGNVRHLGTRECSLQRRHQKLVEIAPAVGIPSSVSESLISAAITLAQAANVTSLSTVEFLVDREPCSSAEPFAFIEVNARLQVEHTVTEEVYGVDLVAAQLRIADGAGLGELGFPPLDEHPSGIAVQVRLNTETMSEDGSINAEGGQLRVFDVPSGPGVRVDSYGYTGYSTNPRFDSLLAKIIVHEQSDDLGLAISRSVRALSELRVEGVRTNGSFLRALLSHPDVASGDWYTRFVDDHAQQLVAASSEYEQVASNFAAAADPAHPEPAQATAPDGTSAVVAPMLGTVVAISAEGGQTVASGAQLIVLEAMKMEHVIVAPFSCTVAELAVSVGETVALGQPLVFVSSVDAEIDTDAVESTVDPDLIREDLAAVMARHDLGLDRSRPDAVERRRRVGLRTTRENIEDLVDEGSFVEYGPLALAAQRSRRSEEWLIANTPGDGMVTGLASVNADAFGAEASRCVVMSYDYTVFAGTQGHQNHRKTDRMFDLAASNRLPLILFGEGGGGRPGDTDGFLGLDNFTFFKFGALSGLVPLVGIVAGRSFAGHAAFLGCCDVIIAAKGTSLGMGGPAMIEGGGLGIFTPEEVGPLSVQAPNGVVDIVVDDEAHGVRVAQQYLSYFQGNYSSWETEDQRRLRHVIPENRLRAYDVHSVIDLLADSGSVLELRSQFGVGMVTSLVRVAGRPLGVVANNPTHLAGAITSDGADKAARFMQLCDSFDIPILMLCDTPGIMVGPEVEKTAIVRHASRLFVLGASLSVPCYTIVLRKAYGLGAMAMAAGSFKATDFTIAWPTGEFGGMGLEGNVRLGFKKELEAIDDVDERESLFSRLVAELYEKGRALNSAAQFEIDDVIDPAESRRWIEAALASRPAPEPRHDKKRRCVDAW